MGEEKEAGAGSVSKREIAAAWACCGLVALLGAFLPDLGYERDDTAITAYAGARIPGGAGQGPHEPEADPDPGDDPAGEVGIFANHAAPLVISSGEMSANSEPARHTKHEGRHCRYILRQSGIRYSAAAARLADAGAVSGVREAVQ
jgi:hypothetical protein